MEKLQAKYQLHRIKSSLKGIKTDYETYKISPSNFPKVKNRLAQHLKQIDDIKKKRGMNTSKNIQLIQKRSEEINQLQKEICEDSPFVRRSSFHLSSRRTLSIRRKKSKDLITEDLQLLKQQVEKGNLQEEERDKIRNDLELYFQHLSKPQFEKSIKTKEIKTLISSALNLLGNENLETNSLQQAATPPPTPENCSLAERSKLEVLTEEGPINLDDIGGKLEHIQGEIKVAETNKDKDQLQFLWKSVQTLKINLNEIDFDSLDEEKKEMIQKLDQVYNKVDTIKNWLNTETDKCENEDIQDGVNTSASDSEMKNQNIGVQHKQFLLSQLSWEDKTDKENDLETDQNKEVISFQSKTFRELCTYLRIICHELYNKYTPGLDISDLEEASISINKILKQTQVERQHYIEDSQGHQSLYHDVQEEKQFYRAMQLLREQAEIFRGSYKNVMYNKIENDIDKLAEKIDVVFNDSSLAMAIKQNIEKIKEVLQNNSTWDHQDDLSGQRVLREEIHNETMEIKKVTKLKAVASTKQETKEKPLEILNVHQYFRDDFNINSIDSLNDLEKVQKIFDYGKMFEDKVRTFDEEKYSLEYFVLDEKLMQLIEKLDKVKCYEDQEVTQRKIAAIEYIKKLHAELDIRAKGE